MIGIKRSLAVILFILPVVGTAKKCDEGLVFNPHKEYFFASISKDDGKRWLKGKCEQPLQTTMIKNGDMKGYLQILTYVTQVMKGNVYKCSDSFALASHKDGNKKTIHIYSKTRAECLLWATISARAIGLVDKKQ